MQNTGSRRAGDWTGTQLGILVGILEDGGNGFGMAFDDSGGVAVAADAEGVFAGDFHEVGGLVEEMGDGAVFH